MNELALFTGVGGGLLSSKLLQWRTVCAVESNPYCIRVLLQRQLDGILEPFPIWDDVCSFVGEQWRGRVDVVSGGFPCQAFSTASHGRKTARDLWPHMLRIVQEVCPVFVFAENVSAKAIESAAIDLFLLGYIPSVCKVSAADCGGDHERVRHWLFAYAHNEVEFLLEVNAKMGSVQELQTSIWDVFPDSERMADGLAHRVERYRAIGNGQVPVVAAKAWHVLCQEAAAGELKRRDLQQPTAAVCNTDGH